MSGLDFSLLSVRDLLSLDACTRCGECVPACPVLAAGEEHATALNKIALWRQEWRGQGGGLLGPLARFLGRRPEPDREEMVAATYDCTLCGRCAQVCPVFIDTRQLWLGQRRQLARAGLAPEAIRAVGEQTLRTGNIAGRPAADRLSWLGNVQQAPARGGDPPDVLLFVGCLSSLYPQAFGLPQALLSLLQGLGLRVGTLGQDELCCGFPLYASGLVDEALTLARRNRELIRASGAEVVVTSCPSCYHTLHHWYPEWLGREPGPRVLHAVELLAERLPLLKLGTLPLKVTYHDPCDLGRLSGIYELPRELLRAVPGLELVEMEDNRERSLCCGGGGDVEMVRPELSRAMADRRFAQAVETGAQAIVTACPQCKRALSAAARRARQRMPTLDLAEVLQERSEGVKETGVKE
ncbi:MAG: (Fe-S)-binding protein [Anaerolineae bacterium]|nr:(Fe-S)-binding protein [Anaerolineae bacterium]